jgi:AmmeMemoRadiSam system protein A
MSAHLVPRPASYTPDQGRRLLEVAFAAIAGGVRHGAPAAVAASDYEGALRVMRASFVTLKLDGRLRGCIGSLEAVRPLVEDVNANAFAAAFRDPRFTPVSAGELNALSISISVLSEPEPLHVSGEPDLLNRLRPGLDGLILRLRERRATFLPAVWESLPAPRDFLRQLKVKAGLAADDWPAGIEVWRYSAESVE